MIENHLLSSAGDPAVAERDIECNDCGCIQARGELIPMWNGEGVIRGCLECGSTELEHKPMQTELSRCLEDIARTLL